MVPAKGNNLLFTFQFHLLSFSELSLPSSLLAVLSLVPISHHESSSTGKMTQWCYILFNTNISSFCIIIHSPLPYSLARGWKARLKLTTWCHTNSTFKCNKQNTHHFSRNLCRAANSLLNFSASSLSQQCWLNIKHITHSVPFLTLRLLESQPEEAGVTSFLKWAHMGHSTLTSCCGWITHQERSVQNEQSELFPWLPSSLHRTQVRKPQKAPQSWSSAWLGAGNGEASPSP